MTWRMKKRGSGAGERGLAIPEFAIVGGIFLTVVFGIIESSRMLWTHNALTDAVRRGARYAATANSTKATEVKNMVVYGTTTAGTPSQAAAHGLTAAHVAVAYSAGYDTKNGSVTVRITGYPFNFNVPFVSRAFTMPDYKATVTAESAGRVPADI